MRVSELVNLKWKDVTLHGRYPSICVVESKNRDVRTIPISSKIRGLLDHLPKDHEYVFDRGNNSPLYSRDYYLKAVREALLVNGIEGGNVHSFRHTFCARLAEQTGDVVLIKQLAGHKRIETSQIYIDHFSPKRAQQGPNPWTLKLALNGPTVRRRWPDVLASLGQFSV